MTDLLVSTVVAAAERATTPEELWAALDAIGVTALGVPEEHGGSGGTLADALAVARALAAVPVSVPYVESVVLAAWLRARAGLGSGPAALATTREARWAGWFADAVVVADSGAAVLPIGAATGHALDGVPTAPVEPAGLVALPDGVAGQLRLRAALAAACVLTGAMGAALDLAVGHATTRTQFGGALYDFQAVKHALVEAFAERRVAAAATELAIARSAAAPDALAIAVAKARASRAAAVVARVAHQVHGALGLTEEHDLWRYTMRLWVHRDSYGAATEWETFAGRLVRDDLWPALTGQPPSSSTSAPWWPAVSVESAVR